MQLQINENAKTVPAPSLRNVGFAPSVANLIYGTSKINLFDENNTTKNADNHSNYNVIEEIFVIYDICDSRN